MDDFTSHDDRARKGPGPRVPFGRRPQVRVGLLGALVACALSIWFRGFFHEDLDNFAEWVVKLPAVEVVLFGTACGYCTWWLLGRFLGGRTVIPSVVIGVLSTPIGLLLALLLANLYAFPRLWVVTGDVVAALGTLAWAPLASYFFLLITLAQVGPAANVLWPAGLAIALIGRRIVLAARDPETTPPPEP
ncbi:MAG: hypothetical protein H6807_04450 [Planctomycetes bacterium]|nr:hypothetical protein [Planctomycetota bacterium]